MRAKNILAVGFLCVAIVLGENYDAFPLFPQLPNGAPYSSNIVCKEDSRMFTEHLANFTLWAHKSKLFDEAPKFRPDFEIY